MLGSSGFQERAEMFLSHSMMVTIQAVLNALYLMPEELFAYPVSCSTDPDILKQSVIEIVGNVQNYLHGLEYER